jgi:Tfp pilus assembly protein PilF
MLIAARPTTPVISTAIAAIALLSGVAFVQAGFWNNTLALTQHATHYNPRSVSAWTAMGDAYRKLDDAAGPAEQAYRKAIEAQPNAIYPNVNYGNLLRDQGRLNEAIERYNVAYNERHVNAAMYLNFADALIQTGQSVEAGEVLIDVLPAHHNDYRLRTLLGVAFMNQGKLARADQILRDALKDAPADAQTQAALAEVARRRSAAAP